MKSFIFLSFFLLAVSRLDFFAAQDVTEQLSDLLNITDISSNDTEDANATISDELDEAENTTDLSEVPYDSNTTNSTETDNEAVENETTDEPESNQGEEPQENNEEEEQRRALYRNQTASGYDHERDHDAYGERQPESEDAHQRAYEEAERARAAHEQLLREHEEKRRQCDEEEVRRRAEYPVQYTQPIYAAPGQDPYEHPPVQYSQSYEDIPTKSSIQATFKFTSEERCLNFLRRLKSKGRNEHSDHPLSCPPVFDGILCWRSADPGETILQVCPDVPRQSQIYAKRECVNGQWQDYPYANQRLQHHDIRQSNYDDCYQLPAFLEKHGRSDYQSTGKIEPAYVNYPGVQYATPAQRPVAPEDTHSTMLYSYVTAPSQSTADVDGDATTGTSAVVTSGKHQDWNIVQNNIPPRPWMIADGQQCRDFLSSYSLDNTRDGTWCPGTTDGRLCWPASPPGYVAHQPCRTVQPGEGSHQVPSATRQCGINGEWNTTAADGATHAGGHTDLSACGLLLVAAVTPSQYNNDIQIAGLAGAGAILNLRETTALIATTEVTTDAAAIGSTMAQIAGDASRDKPKQPWLLTGNGCETFLKEIGEWDEKQAGSCRGGSDGKICWPTAAKDVTLTQPCPRDMCLDVTKTVSRTCGSNGAWTTATGSYEACFTQDAKDLISMHYSPKTSSAEDSMSVYPLPAFFAFFVSFFLL